MNLYQYGWHMTATPDDYDIQAWQPAKSAKRFEPGSNNLLGIHALSASLSLVEELGMKNIEKQLAARISYLRDSLASFAGINLLTPANPRQRAGIIAFKIAGVDLRELHKRLLQNQVICAHRGGAIRFSPHYYTSMQYIDKVLDIMNIII